MQELQKSYQDELQVIKDAIQASDLLATYLEEEDEDVYKQLAQQFEPQIDAVHNKVADNNPLQMIALEEQLLDEAFEGLFLPRILGYSVMRGQINNDFKYIKPQSHFQNILLKICNSANFDGIKSRIGQSIQIGFAMSSDIWITNLLNLVNNSKVKAFLNAQRIQKFRDLRSRHTAYVRFQKQFVNYHYHYTSFPETVGELKILEPGVRSFLVHRSINSHDNKSLFPVLQSLLSNPDFEAEKEYHNLLCIVMMFFPLEGELKTTSQSKFEAIRRNPDFPNNFFESLVSFQNDDKLEISPTQDKNFSALIDLNTDDEISRYYKLMDIVHGKGYVHEDSIDAVKKYYDQHLGTSIQNKAVRNVILQYISNFIGNLEMTEYSDFFEIFKTAVVYINIFSNEQFNQDVKGASLRYVKKLIKHYTDKRGKDYQDIKKFVSTTFQDLGFLKAKEVVELFKTRRKPKKD